MTYIDRDDEVSDGRPALPEQLPREMTLRELRNFVTLADTKSVTAASRLVGLSQPAMSASLANLERAVGVTLFVRRRGRGVHLTPEGRVLAHEARELLVQAHELQSRMTRATATTPVNLGSLVTVAPLVVPRLVRAFAESAPEIPVTVRVGAQDEMIDWLRTGEIHVALTYDLELGSAFEFHRLVDAIPLAMLPSDHPLAGRRSLTLHDLVDEPYILLDLPLSSQYFTSLFLAVGAPYEPAMRVDDLALVRSLVGSGFGYSLVNLRPASNETLDGGQVAHVTLETPVRPLRLGLARLASSTPPRSVSTFIDFATAFDVGRAAP